MIYDHIAAHWPFYYLLIGCVTGLGLEVWFKHKYAPREQARFRTRVEPRTDRFMVVLLAACWPALYTGLIAYYVVFMGGLLVITVLCIAWELLSLIAVDLIVNPLRDVWKKK